LGFWGTTCPVRDHLNVLKPTSDDCRTADISPNQSTGIRHGQSLRPVQPFPLTLWSSRARTRIGNMSRQLPAHAEPTPLAGRAFSAIVSSPITRSTHKANGPGNECQGQRVDDQRPAGGAWGEAGVDRGAESTILTRPSARFAAQGVEHLKNVRRRLSADRFAAAFLIPITARRSARLRAGPHNVRDHM
jgi:hypothetical protein